MGEISPAIANGQAFLVRIGTGYTESPLPPLACVVCWHRVCVLNRKIPHLAHHLALVGSSALASPGTQDPEVVLCFIWVSWASS